MSPMQQTASIPGGFTKRVDGNRLYAGTARALSMHPCACCDCLFCRAWQEQVRRGLTEGPTAIPDAALAMMHGA